MHRTFFAFSVSWCVAYDEEMGIIRARERKARRRKNRHIKKRTETIAVSEGALRTWIRVQQIVYILLFFYQIYT